MCYKPNRAEHEAREKLEARPDDEPRPEREPWREHEARRRGPTTRPRGNPEAEWPEVERSSERLHAVLGQ
jgi:hypothetical protein